MTITSGIYVGPDISELWIGNRPVTLVAIGNGTSTLTGFPTATSVGIDAIEGWEPTTTIEDPDGAMYIDEEGALYEDVEFINTDMIVRAPHVTFRRCNLICSALFNSEATSDYIGIVGNDLLFEDSTIRFTPPGDYRPKSPGGSMIGTAGMRVNRSSILDVNEAFRISGSQWDLVDPDDPLGHDIHITDTYVRLATPDPFPPGFDWHGDCFQAFDTGVPGDGVHCVVRNSVFNAGMEPGLPSNSAIITGVGHLKDFDIDGLIMSGGSYTLYHRVGGDYRNVFFVDGTPAFGAIVCDVPAAWDLCTTWESIALCTLDGAGQPDEIIGYFPLGYDGGPLDPP